MQESTMKDSYELGDLVGASKPDSVRSRNSAFSFWTRN
jgi:hypothetical protein